MTPDLILPELMLGLNPDFSDPETERQFAALYTEQHDALLDPRHSRTPAQEQRLAFNRALLTQRGLEESRLPWELGVSYNLRLSEALERQAARSSRRP